MRRAAPIVVLTVAVLCLVAASAAVAAQPAPGGDSVTGSGHLVIDLGLGQHLTFDLAVDAQSGPSGEQPAGTLTNGTVGGTVLPVICLSVGGNQAVIGGRGAGDFPFAGELVRIIDTRTLGAPDILEVQPTATVPTTCPLVGPPFLISGPIASGDFSVVDAPPSPTSRQQCKRDGWKQYGFTNQGQCVAFVERGPNP